jgi:hypothetical protein
VPLPRHSGKPPFFGFSLWISTNQQKYITKHIYHKRTNMFGIHNILQKPHIQKYTLFQVHK